jgi:small subunit ribosomal protein S10
MEKIRLKIKSFDPTVLDRFAKQIAVTARSTGATVSGPIPLPTKRTLFAVIRGPHIDKRGQEHFVLKRHARLIEISNATPETMDKISQIDVPPGVDVKVSIIQ